jgi:opacity protein-like surface antigen
MNKLLSAAILTLGLASAAQAADIVDTAVSAGTSTRW